MHFDDDYTVFELSFLGILRTHLPYLKLSSEEKNEMRKGIQKICIKIRLFRKKRFQGVRIFLIESNENYHKNIIFQEKII